MRIAMIGAGYVGLVSSACFADAGHSVTCVDKDANRIAKLNCGILPIFEPGLADMVEKNRQAGRLDFSNDLGAAVQCAEAVFISVGTPARQSDGHADLSQVYEATAAIAPALRPHALIVVKSTVPVGTCDEVEVMIAQQRPRTEFHVVSNPEFLRAGAAIADFLSPDRVVIGAEECEVRQRMTEIYRSALHEPRPFLCTSRRSAELLKYAANTFLATKIAFINEVANLCERVGADVHDVSRGMGLDPRIGSRFLFAGPGFGGSCFPKDALALVKMGEDNEVPMRIAESVIASNEARKHAMTRKIAAAIGGSLRGKTLALFGLTFKADTDDMRESPALAIAAGLRDMRANLRVYDPAGMEHASKMLPSEVTCCCSEYDAAEGADAVVIVTEWSQFRAIDLELLRARMRSPVVVDLRSIYRVEDLAAHGFRYYRIGAPRLVPALPVDRAGRQPLERRRLDFSNKKSRRSEATVHPRRQRATANANAAVLVKSDP